VVMSAFFAARTEVEQQAAERKEKRTAREMKSRLEGTARRYIEHEAGGDVEITSVGDPYLNGGYWAVQVYYVKDDYRGRRAKVTVVLFSPLNYEVVGARDVI
jgi:hypothetical protein